MPAASWRPRIVDGLESLNLQFPKIDAGKRRELKRVREALEAGAPAIAAATVQIVIALSESVPRGPATRRYRKTLIRRAPSDGTGIATDAVSQTRWWRGTMERPTEIGSSIVVKGDITAHEDILVSGRVEGSIAALG